ncbi:MAG: helix-turn-helix transcriptional regulator [Acetatifactor sp.]|nr:helix-turn-helix transcriptional regulator [Acetatifactor sp.]
MANVYLGQLITELRRKNNMTQRELAAKLNISSSNLSKWEHGALTPGMEALGRIAEIFQITGDDLLHPEETLQRLQQGDVDASILQTTSPTKSSFFKRRWIPVLSFALVIVLIFSGSIAVYLLRQPRYVIIDEYYDYDGPYGVHYIMNIQLFGQWDWEDIDKFEGKMRTSWENHEFAEDADAVEFRFYRNRDDAVNRVQPEQWSVILQYPYLGTLY